MSRKGGGIQWFAGFVDGEGCLGIYRNNRTGQLLVKLQISNTHLPALKTIAKLFSGNRKIRINKKKGKSGFNKLPCYQISWVGKKTVEPILKAIQPYCIVKKDQIDLVLRKWMPRIKYAGRHGFKNKKKETKIRANIQKRLAKMKHKSYIL